MAEKQRQNDIELISLSEAAKLTGYTPEYLNLLSREGKLKAEKIGRNWYTKIEWVNLFLAPISNKSNESSLVTLSEAAGFTGYTPEYLNSLARSKKLKAIKIGRNWHTKKEWLDSFLASASGESEEAIVGQEKLAEEISETSTVQVLDENPKENQGNNLSSEIISEPEREKTISYFPQIFAIMSVVIIIIPLIFAGTLGIKKFSKNINSKQEFIRMYLENAGVDSEITNENGTEGLVAGEENNQASGAATGIVLASENYKIQNINIGGDIMILGNGENLPLAISDIKSESFIVGKKEEVKLVISWKTNKMSVSEISYSKSSGQNLKTLQENSYGFNHSVIISELEPRTSYIYRIKCKDRWSNAETTGYFGIYTASKSISVFDLISNALGDVFSWAIKK